MAVVIPIVSKYDNTGVKRAKGAFGGLAHSAKRLKRIMAGGLSFIGLSAGVRGLYQAAKAADADAKSQQLLATQMMRNAKASKLQIAGAESFIQKLSMQVGIIDDNLRPSLGKLVAVTGNVKKAQKLLVVTLDLAAASGKDQATVQAAVAKAYVGNTTGLKRMFPQVAKLTAAYEKQHGKVKTLTDKTKEARWVIAELGKTNAGIAAQQASPFDKMTAALDRLKEAIGAAILPDFIKFVDWLIANIPKLVKKFDELGNPSTDLGKSFKQLKDDMGGLVKNIGDFFALFSGGKGGGVGFINFLDWIVKNSAGFLAFFAGLKIFKIFTNPVGKTSLLAMLLELIAKLGGLLRVIPGLGTLLTILTTPGSTALYGPGTGKRPITPYKAPSTPMPLAPGGTSLVPSTGLPGVSGGNVTINISGVIGDKVAVGKAVMEAIKAYQKKNGGSGAFIPGGVTR